MLGIYLELLPIFLLILVGVLLRFLGIVKKDEASLFLRLVFYVTMPALVLTNIPATKITHDFIYLPLIPPVIGFILFAISYFVGKRILTAPKTLGVFIISSLILNTAFIFPFVSMIYKEEGISRILIFDVGNVIMIFVFAYYQACKYGNQGIKRKEIYNKLLRAIPLWAIIIAMVMNITEVQFRGPVLNFAKITGDLTIPLLLISVGVFFEPKLSYFKVSLIAIFIRMGLGMLLGLAIVYVMGFEGLTKYVAILATATPIGYNVLTFSSIENLDKEFAADLVSTSILIALFYVPFILYLLA
jgi:malate permease and related proteins